MCAAFKVRSLDQLLQSNLCTFKTKCCTKVSTAYRLTSSTTSISRLFPFKTNNNRFAIFSIIFSTINGRYRLIEL